MNGASVARLLMVERFKVHYKPNVDYIYRAKHREERDDIVDRVARCLLMAEHREMLSSPTSNPALALTLTELSVGYGVQPVEAWLNTPLEDQ